MDLERQKSQMRSAIHDKSEALAKAQRELQVLKDAYKDAENGLDPTLGSDARSIAVNVIMQRYVLSKKNHE